MQRNKVHHVSTAERVASDLGVSEAFIQDLTLGLEPEDGVIWVYGATMTTGSWPSPMKALRRSNSSSKNIIASHHRNLDPAPQWSGAHSRRIRTPAVFTECVRQRGIMRPFQRKASTFLVVAKKSRSS
ncbi:hypothetical protein [Mesorhizobium sp.]